MVIDEKEVVSISEANQNFSKVAILADKCGEVYIFKNNKPRYKLVNLEQNTDIQMSDEEKIDFIAGRILKDYLDAFVELAK